MAESPSSPETCSEPLLPPPTHLEAEIKGVMITEEQLRRRVTELANEIARDYRGQELTVLGILDGAFIFTADLVRQLALPVTIDFMAVSSYRGRTEPGSLRITREPAAAVTDHHVLVVDDILDNGTTLAIVQERLLPLRPRDLRLCVLLAKRRFRSRMIQVDYSGFAIPDEFVVGYGLDYRERYRHLPFIGVPHELPDPETSIPVSVSFHSWFRELTNTESIEIGMPENSNLADLLERLYRRYPRLAEARRSALVAVDLEYQTETHPLRPGNRVALFPPVQGG